MLMGFAAMLTMLFLGWIFFQALNGRPVKPHVAMYLLSVLTGIFTLAFFLSAGFNFIIKLVVAIIFGIILILAANRLQRRLASGQR